ncbi:restriction endonuclease subunit S [Arenicella xantha]|uniref:Type I restriction enzyme S subunit n=1 Tax=Arenicella xantha TaxID=644221 RepID=A0A395JMU8_9GAMM|nr:restriction endonuclease subunit S [Arenicella xantha]RBP52981.1 type I restriction enzyme S subunit [Arenicella xantha]
MAGKYQGYPEYKNIGSKWVPEIPVHWEPILFKRIVNEIKDGTHGTHVRVNDGLPFLSAKNVLHKGIEITESESMISEKDHQEITGNGFPRKGDLLITCVGTIGRTCVYEFDVPYAFQRSVAFLRLSKLADPKFYKYFVESKTYQSQLEAQSKASAQSGVYMGDLVSTSTVLAPIDEQQKIANFLDHETAKIDTLIEKQKRLIKLLKEKRLALVDIASKGAELVRLENCSDLIAREVVCIDDEFYTPIGLYNKGRGLFHKDPTLGKELGDSDFFYIEDNDLIFSGQFAWEGAVALTDEKDRGCIASHRYPVIKGNDGILDTAYLWAFFTSQKGAFLMNECSRGAAGRNRPLNISYLMKEKIPVPSMIQQLAISRLVWSERKIEERIKKVISTLNEKRTSLISAVVTGKIDVRNWQAPE